MNRTKKINGLLFKKSSLSRRDDYCVGVSITSECVWLTNTKSPDKIIRFTFEEWEAFIGGVKLGEFEVIS